jgi:hypothetical protein
MKIVNSSIVTAFDSAAIGTRVTDASKFGAILDKAVAATDFEAQRVPGQAFIMLPSEAVETVSAGVGKRTQNVDDFVTRVWRGKVGTYLKREHAAPAKNVAAVVNTIAAALADPDVKADAAETARLTALQAEGATHVLIIVLAFATEDSPLPPLTFLHNLAGGNNEALNYSADEIRSMAAEIDAYWSVWGVVAD